MIFEEPSTSPAAHHGGEQESPSSSPPKRRRNSCGKMKPLPPGNADLDQADTNESPSAQWILQRGNGSGMRISEHLGDTSNMVDSLTHDLSTWSLVSVAPTIRKKKAQQVRASKRAVMKALSGRDQSALKEEMDVVTS